MKHPNLIDGVKIITLFVIYFGVAKFGLSFDAVSGFATLIWLPSGISLAALLLFGYRLWPAITIAAFLVNITIGATAPIALGIAVGNTLEALIGAYLFQRSGVERSFARLQDILFFTFLVAPIGAGISATIGTSSLFVGQFLNPHSYFVTWRAWWIGDLISIILVTPFLLMWSKRPTVSLRISQTIELLLLALATTIISIIIFDGLFHIFKEGTPVTYFIFPPLIWASLRFGQRGAVTAVVVISLFAILETIQGFGPFGTGRLSERLLLLQSFIGVTVLTSMTLAATDSERKKYDQRKDEFISLASHELKTPITTIKLFNQTLQKKLTRSSNKQARLYLGKMNTQIDKLTLLISDLLDVSKIQAGKLEFHNEYFPLTELLYDTVEVIQATTSPHTLVIKNRKKKINSRVFADKERINQVIINLLTNAIKYSPHAKKVVVTAVEQGEKIIIGIQDYGVGIKPEHQKKIFQRYYRIEDKDHIFSGLGIGLYISYEIIKRSGGNLWVESNNTKTARSGCTFYISLPIQKITG